ncbi:MAG: hypothetical protein K2I25_01815 [Muribaculaceae bacterium]|nr:hypothetical protein [Muribaculaceae bacterium]
MKRLITILLFLIGFSSSAFATLPDGFRIESIDKSVKDFQLDSIKLTSPIDYYLSRAWVRVSGKAKHWADISTSKFYNDPNAPDEIVDEDFHNYVLNETIDAIVSFRDSVAAIVTHTEGEDLYMLNYCWIEDGRWVNGGQGMAHNLNEAEDKLLTDLPFHHSNLPRITQIKDIPTDISPFVDFLSHVDTSPEQFMLEMLRSHKLVINGEYHRRKVSWDVLKNLIALPDFAETTGTIFMELPSWCQSYMDEFIKSDTINPELILQIFREEQPLGWWDSGEFEFICDLWHINQSLPQDKRIKVILADYQIPYSLAANRGDFIEKEDRNTHMANIIANTIAASNDSRSYLFLVGCAHAYKSHQSGFASSAAGQEAALTAGAQLSAKLGKNNVFTIFQHVLPGDNRGNNKSPIRGGVFDRAFEADGNRPLGFRLADSPFGNEPFDGIYEIKYNVATGNYSDNFDGYLFLHPIVDEPKARPLTEIFDDEFVTELKRRASAMGTENIRHIWFGRTAPELTSEYIIQILTEE